MSDTNTVSATNNTNEFNGLMFNFGGLEKKEESQKKEEFQALNFSQDDFTITPNKIPTTPIEFPTTTSTNTSQTIQTNTATTSTPPAPSGVNPTLPPISQTPPPLTPPAIIIKKGSKISPLGFGIGCGLFGIIIVGLISILLYFAIQNPDQFKGILTIDDIKTGLKLFVGLFFGIIFFSGFGIGIFNLYKLITTKTGGKIGYSIGLIISILFLIGSSIGGTIAFNKINEIIGTTGSNSNLLIPSIEFKDGMRSISEGFPIIAPTSIYYGVNQDILKRLISNNFSKKIVNTLTLSCGNQTEQMLPYDSTQKGFIGSCLYTKKGTFNIKIIANITDPNTNTKQDEVIDLGPIFVKSEITLTPSQGTLSLNDAKDEIIIGKAPTKLTINSSKIFEDFKLSNYTIQRDLDNDGNFDATNDTSLTHQFRTPQLQTIAYTLPDMPVYGDLVYLITFRVQQNEVPICTLTANPGQKTTEYAIDATFDDHSTAITSYLYKVKDIITNKTIVLPNNSKAGLSYEFPKKGSYIIQLEYATDEGKRGYCESDVLNVGTSAFTPHYSINFRGSNDSKRSSALQSGAVSFKDGKITVSSLPMRIQFIINDISPQTKQTVIEIKNNGKIILSPDNKTYEFTITKAGDQEISMNIDDPTLGATSEIKIPILVVQQDVIGQMKAFPDTVGVSPYEVTLDATTTTLTDKSDEIIYFSRDFGDGKKNPNTSQGRVSHTYIYDEKLQSGTYKPSVTIITKKGKKSVIPLGDPILIKKPSIQAKISIDSHPAQVAKVGDQVSFTLQTDGLPTFISRDFGNGNPIECNDRSCASVPTLFEKAGKYEIKASITYADLNKTNATTTLIVE